MSKKEIKVKVSGELADVVKQLEDVIRSLKEGKLVIQKNTEFITLTPQEKITLEIEAEQKKGKEELSIELSWRIAEPITVEESSGLTISSREPVVEKTETTQMAK